MKAKTKVKKEMDNSTITAGDFNISLNNGQNNYTEDQGNTRLNTINQLDLTDFYRTLQNLFTTEYSTQQQQITYSQVHMKVSRTDHMPGHKTNFKKFKNRNTTKYVL